MESQISKVVDNNKIYQLWSMQRQIIIRIKNQKINKKSIILIGDTNVGKTTLLYYLSGMKLNLVQNYSKKTKQIHPETVYQDAMVNNSQSTTQVPNIFSQICDQQDITIIDMPGMNDTKFINALSNMFTFLSVFQKLLTKTTIHIVFVISEQIFDPIEIKVNLQQIVSRFDIQMFRNEKNLSIIFTKTQIDKQTLQQKFIEFIDEIHQDIQDDEQQEELVELIDLIKELSEMDQIMYLFPKETPNEEQGLKITQTIYQRELFAGNEQFMLNEMIVDNVIKNEKIIVPEFEDNLIQTIQQSFDQVSSCVGLMVGMVRFLHKKFVTGLFETETDFQTQLQSFYHKNSVIFQEFSPDTSVDKFKEIVSLISENISENKEIYLLDKTLIQLFVGVSSNEQTECLQTSVQFTIHVITRWKDCYKKMYEILSTYKETESLVGLFTQIQSLLSWLCSEWYPSLSTVKSLQIVSFILKKYDEQLRQKNALHWKQIRQQQKFIDILNEFSSKFHCEQSQYQSYQSQQQVIFVEQEVVDNGYYGSKVEELKKKYMSVRSVTIVDQVKMDVEKMIESENKLQKGIRQIVNNLECQVITQVKRAQQEGECKLHLQPQRIGLILFQLRNLRHRLFLISSITNFTYYLKFIFFSLISQHQQHQILPIIQGFIQNLCIILDQYSLFEQQMRFMMFACLYEKIGKVLERGIKAHHIDGVFISEYLLKHVRTIVGQVDEVVTLECLEDVVAGAYNYLISQCSLSKQQVIQYTKQMTLMLEIIKKKQLNCKEKSNSGWQTQWTDLNTKKTIQQPNYFVLQDFQLSSMIDKIQLLQERNNNPEIYQIHYHFHPQLYRLT